MGPQWLHSWPGLPGGPCWWWCWCCQQSRGRHYCEWGYSHSLRCSDFQPKPRLLRRDCGSAGVIQSGVKLNVQKFWDPITAAQASGGAFCCAALYYGSDGLGRGGATGITGVTKNKDFKPNALVGDAMETQNVAGGMCSDGSSSTSVKQGLSAALNVKEKEFLEGQAFFASVAPSMYVLPKVNSLQATQTANAAKQKKRAQTLTTMLN